MVLIPSPPKRLHDQKQWLVSRGKSNIAPRAARTCGRCLGLHLLGIARGTVSRLPSNTSTAQAKADPARYCVLIGNLRARARQSPNHYRARIELTLTKFRNLPEGFALRPGMRALCDIKIGRRWILDYC